MIFIHNNSLSLSENSMVTFVGNRAIDTGGAIYIVTNVVYIRDEFCTYCFLSLIDTNSAKQLIFTNNFAGQGGDIVYGRRMESTCKLPSNI